VAKREGLLTHSASSKKKQDNDDVMNCDAGNCVPKVVAVVNNAGIGYYASFEMADIQQVITNEIRSFNFLQTEI
jgi:hypothetical protein